MQIKPLRLSSSTSLQQICRPCASARKQTRRCAASTEAQSPVDVLEILKLLGATAGQMAAMTGVFYGIDKVQVAAAEVVPSGVVPPEAAVFLLLLFLSVRSQVFSIFNAQRPFQSKEVQDKGFGDRVLPAWCPPGPVFGIVWTTLSLLRAAAGTLVFQQVGALCCIPIIAFAAHLATGDTWNYVNNAQARLGVSAMINTLLVWPAAAAAVAVYFQVSAAAGLTLLPLSLWLTVANALVWGTWHLNGRQPLLPRKAAASE